MPQNVVCGFCKRGEEVVDVCGALHEEKLDHGESVSAHRKCMQYSALLTQYQAECFGGFKPNAVKAEIQRGKKLKCSICKGKTSKNNIPKTGATAGCALKKCPKTFHFYCAFVDKMTVTKRLVVSFKQQHQKALYRVFCCAEHKDRYIEDLKADKDGLFTGDESDSSEEDDGWEDWREFQDYKQTDNGNHDVSYYDLSAKAAASTSEQKNFTPPREEPSNATVEQRNMTSPEKGPTSTTSPEKIPSSRTHKHKKRRCPHPDDQDESAEDSTRKRKPVNRDVDTSPKQPRKSSDEDFQRQKPPKKNKNLSVVLIEKLSGDFKLPWRYSPVVRLSSVNDSRSNDLLTSVSSEASGCSTPSCEASSDGSSTHEDVTKLPTVLRRFDLSEKVTNIPSNSVAVCIMDDLGSSMDEERIVTDIVQSRYGITRSSIYMWHRVVKKHGMKSAYMLEFMRDLADCLQAGDMEKVAQSLICPQSHGLLEKYENIRLYQEKWKHSIRAQLDQDICKMIYKGLKKLVSTQGHTLCEILPRGDNCVLVLLISPNFTGFEDLVDLFPSSEADRMGDNTAGQLYPLLENGSRKKKGSSTKPVEMEEEIKKFMLWCVVNIPGPVQLQTLPAERKFLCSSGYKDESIAFRMSQFLNRVYTYYNAEAGVGQIVCIVALDEAVVNPYEYLLRVLTEFVSKAQAPRYAFVDSKNVNVSKLINELKVAFDDSNMNLEFLCTVNPEEHTPAAFIIKASNKAYLTQSGKQ